METKINIADYIDHTLLKPEATLSQINTLIDEAITHSFKGVCVNSLFIKTVADRLINTPILPVCVIGFPLGACLTDAKCFEAEKAVALGAKEIDMVQAIGLLKEKNYAQVKKDIEAVCKSVSVPVKVILETGLLTDEEISISAKIAAEAGAAFVKTCTGFSIGSAKLEHIQLIRAAIPSHVKIKASGGVKSTAQALEFIQAGVDRIGTSSGVGLVSGSATGNGY